VLPLETSVKYSTPEAIELLRRGTLAFSKMEAAGVRVDKGYIDQTWKDLDASIADLHRRLKNDKEMYKPWVRRFGSKTNLFSRDQLRDVLYLDLGVEVRWLTKSGKASTSKTVLDKVDIEGVNVYREMEQKKDIQSTYLEGIRREMVEVPGVGWFVHPSYGLHRAATYRSNCVEPNWQNIPSRDWELAQMVRKAYIPRKGRHLVEVDFGMVEVIVAAIYTRDPALMKYVTDPKSDMHTDMACQIFFLTKEQVKEMKKTARHAAKNMFVFPEFYGSAWFKCAPDIWDEMTRLRHGQPHGWELPDGTPLVKHLRRNGIKALGPCEAKGEPPAGTFAAHLKQIERHFWDKRFPVYRDWKRSWFDQYQQEGGFSMLTGFRVNQKLKRTDVTNYPIQGSAFHCELKTCIHIVDWIEKYKMKSRLVGTIHDCDVGDVPTNELQDYCDMFYEYKTVKLAKEWKWISVPMKAEVEVTDKGESWAAKKEWKKDDGEWTLKL
jgi:DNA polymerase I-like protein with 3'-5' exonuclease and polymerase domains